METPQLPDMVPDSVKNATPEEVEKFPYGFALLALIAAISFLASVVLWVQNQRSKDKDKSNESCLTENVALKEENRQLRKENVAIYRDLLVKTGMVDALQPNKSDSTHNQ